MTKPYSDEIIAGIDQLEEKYDIELVSIGHHEKWVERCERLITQRDELLEACKAVSPVLESADSWSDDDHTFLMDKHDFRRLKRQIAAAIAAVKGSDANTAPTDPPERPRCQHETPRRLSYHGDQADTRKRLAKGERPKLCRVCERWIWPEYWWRTIEEGGTTLLDDAI